MPKDLHGDSLSITERTINQNIKLLRVNAQVTAVMSILETVGNLHNWIVWSILDRIFGYELLGFGGNAISMLLSMLLNLLILPYLFLMNTRYNKNRVVEEGWVNVLKNVRGNLHKSQILSVVQIEEKTKSVTRKSSFKSEKTFIKDKEKQGETIQNTKIKPSIYIVKYDRHLQNVRVIEQMHPQRSPIDPNDYHSIIPSIDALTNLDTPTNNAPCCSKNETDDNVPSLLMNAKYKSNPIENYKCIRSHILSNLLSNINNEESYIMNFMRLIRIEEAKKNHKTIDDIQDDDEDEKIFDTMPHFVGNVKRKRKMRYEVLKNLISIQDEDSNYDDLLENFINMEEKFVDQGC